MNFLERLFGISLDGGNGTFEFLFFLYLCTVAITGFALAKGEVAVAHVLHSSMTLPQLLRFCTKQKTDCGA